MAKKKTTSEEKDEEAVVEIATEIKKEAVKKEKNKTKVEKEDEEEIVVEKIAKKIKEEISDETRIESKPKKAMKVKLEDVVPKVDKDANTLIPLNDYIRSGTYIGTKVITPHMRPFIYRRRNDGIAIINTNIIDEKLKEAARFLGDFNPENIVVVCKRESGWRAVKLFSELTGIRCFTKKYPAGIITNTALPDFFRNRTSNDLRPLD